MATIGVYDEIGWRPRVHSWARLAPLVGFFLAVLLSGPIVLAGPWEEFQVDTLGWLTFLGGAALRWWSALYLGAAGRCNLVTTGPYSLCRYPAQLGSLLLGFSLALFFRSPMFGVGFALAATGYLWLTVPAEEEKLGRLFGSAYQQYCRRVPRFWPRPGQFQTAETIVVEVANLVREFRRTALWIWLPVVGKALAHLRAETWWPHVWTLS
jgi:protein-S-isoprenylcysteine O-methyltransferase Ste14